VLEDRRVVPILDLGAHATDAVYGHGPMGVIVASILENRVHIIGAGAAEFASYRASPSRRSSPLANAIITTNTHVIGWVAGEQRTTVMVHLHYEAMSGDERRSFEEAVEVWTVQADGSAKTQRLITSGTSDYDVPRLTKDGRYALWFEDGSLKLAGVESGDRTSFEYGDAWPEQQLVTGTQIDLF
jgi:hypothetical protein